jgi:hypothetical protein
VVVIVVEVVVCSEIGDNDGTVELILVLFTGGTVGKLNFSSIGDIS